MATEGIRVLAVAQGNRWIGPAYTPADFTFELLGLVGFADPLRASVPAAVAQCLSAGIRVVMITGDYPATAIAIARQAGLDATEAVTGDTIDKLEDVALSSMVRDRGSLRGSCRSKNCASCRL